MSHSDEEKLHASVLVAPAKERRRYRKQRRQAADQLHREQAAETRDQRQVRLDRVQAVDLRQPLLARIAGLAELKFEAADGGTLPALRVQNIVALRHPLSLMHGWLPLTVQILAATAVILALGWRTRRWRLIWLPWSAFIGAILAGVLVILLENIRPSVIMRDATTAAIEDGTWAITEKHLTGVTLAARAERRNADAHATRRRATAPVGDPSATAAPRSGASA